MRFDLFYRSRRRDFACSFIAVGDGRGRGSLSKDDFISFVFCRNFFHQKNKENVKMSDLVYAMNALGITPYVVGTIVAFSAIALFFGFIKKA